MGQGVYTSLTMLVAEELDVELERVRIQFAPVDAAYNIPNTPLQFTAGSLSVRTLFEPLRKAGAIARAMLIAAAATRWQVDAKHLTTANGTVTDGTRRASYGELAALAATIEPPQSVQLKDPKDFKLIGKSVRRLDAPGKVTGRTVYGIDVQRPDMLIAMVARAPVFGATGTRAKACRFRSRSCAMSIVGSRQDPDRW